MPTSSAVSDKYRISIASESVDDFLSFSLHRDNLARKMFDKMLHETVLHFRILWNKQC
jgi:hypothetical protein